MKKRDELKILYFQIRDDEETKAEELVEFSEYSGLSADQFRVANVFEEPDFPSSMAEDFDAVFVGGSSDASVMKPEKYLFVPKLEAVLRWCAENDKPVFASCFGFQAAVTGLGGEMMIDERNVGRENIEINVTDEGKKDELFKDVGDSITTISWHKERAKTLPEGVVVLATSDTCPYDAFKLPGKPFYAFQFHPEIGRKGLVSRLSRYIHRYVSDGDEALQHVIDNCQETPESNALVRKFVDRVILQA